MKLKTVLKRVLKIEGRNSQILYKIKGLIKSKEFDYLVDVKKL
jgi:hypothetical protein